MLQFVDVTGLPYSKPVNLMQLCWKSWLVASWLAKSVNYPTLVIPLEPASLQPYNSNRR